MDVAAAIRLLATLDLEATHRDVEGLMRDAGWASCGAGDWAVALAAPDADVVARLSPFDPVGPYTARLYREASGTGRVPRLVAHRTLVGGGDLQLMERLQAVPTVDAAEFLAALARPEPELAELAGVVMSIHADARRDLPWCGPLDENPANVMRTTSGNLVLTDPYYADGPYLYRTATEDPDVVVARIPESQRRYLTEIPLAESGPWPPEEREAMREQLRLADDRAG